MSDISFQHAEVLAKIKAAAKRTSQTGPSQVEISQVEIRQKQALPDLVAVSKLQPDVKIAAMLETGQKIFGENRVQEAQRRWGEAFASARKDLELRLIGPLQSNKAADALALFDVIETIDREKILKALLQASEKTGQPMPRLYVQVNTGEEPQKAGLLPTELPRFIAQMRESYKLEPEGLMCIPPAREASAPHFWLLEKLARQNGLARLSMGMSGDFETAVEMGATSVRVGSALFGARGG